MAPPKPLVTRFDKVKGGAVAFAGTRVPFQTLVGYLVEGDTFDSLLKETSGKCLSSRRSSAS